MPTSGGRSCPARKGNPNRRCLGSWGCHRDRTAADRRTILSLGPPAKDNDAGPTGGSQPLGSLQRRAVRAISATGESVAVAQVWVVAARASALP